jgi:hypothetical protein
MTSMTALLVENIKLVMLFLLISSIIGLSHAPGGKATTVHRKAHRRYRWPDWARL